MDKINSRITYYTKYEDKWRDKVAMSPKMRAKQGVTVAAHPNFRFGTRILIPDLFGKLDQDSLFVVQDRGGAVTSKKASGGKKYVFDVYLACNNRKMRSFAEKHPKYMDVFVLR